MANSNDYMDELLNKSLERTPKNKGYNLTLKIGFYDNGKILINDRACLDENQGAWSAARFLLQVIERAQSKMARMK